ncbi:MAG TPA: hypothetical protein VFE61_30870, partial [Candidatus Sulfotelmatobacter sp.]|nr:hypothetical protein [Candidatus Sulfotelmatobacter sp.]
ARAKPLERSRGTSANSGLDIETKNFSATGPRRSFFVDIPFDRTGYLKLILIERITVIMAVANSRRTPRLTPIRHVAKVNYSRSI